ncbi:MAG: hypothetical protein LQ351_007146 [Letrouitia transgressa]|nr:MAG: hypothetical protein LQ351_007146 [Letrouitia transgressa]
MAMATTGSHGPYEPYQLYGEIVSFQAKLVLLEMRLQKAEEERDDTERVLRWLLKFIVGSNASGACPTTPQQCDRQTLKSEISGIIEEMMSVLEDFANGVRQQNAQAVTGDLLGDFEESTTTVTNEMQGTAETGLSQHVRENGDDVGVNRYIARFKKSSPSDSNTDGLSSIVYESSPGTLSSPPRIPKYSSLESGTSLLAVGNFKSFNAPYCGVTKKTISWGGHGISETDCSGQLSSILDPFEARHTLITLPKWKDSQLTTTKLERSVAISENRGAIGLNGSPLERRFPGFFKHGIRFQPTPTMHNLYRTVIVDRLPRSITLTPLLEQVQGGPVYSVKLLETFSITGFSSALIVFVFQQSATRFLRQAQKRPLIFNDIPAKVSLVTTPTWPMPESHYRAILDHLQTRCLVVRNFPRGVSLKEFVEDLHACSRIMERWIERLWLREDWILELRFSSFPSAYQAYGIFTNSAKYTMCDVKFVPDPCSRDFNMPPSQTVNTAAPSARSPPPREHDSTSEIKDDSCRLEKNELADPAGICRGRGSQKKQS